MDLLERVYEILQLDKLDESQQKDIKSKINEVVQMKAKEMANESAKKAVDEIKEELVQDYEKKYEDYKDEITSKFSNFVDEILEQEMQIPEKVYEYARKGELYEPIMEQLKVKLGIDEGAVNEEAKNLLRESKDEITSLKDQVNELRKKKSELEEDAKEMAVNLYLRKKCEGLSEGVKNKVINLLEDVKSKEEIDRKFDLIVDSVKSSSNQNNLNEVTMYCEECGEEVEVNEDEKEEKTCPECGGELKTTNESKGKESVETPDKLQEERNQNQQTSIQEQWLEMIRSNRF